ncbi:hypothetical protein [Amycolatopsis sp. NPDC059657]
MDETERKTEPDTREKTSQAEKEEIRGEQGTAHGDKHDDTDPQSG